MNKILIISDCKRCSFLTWMPGYRICLVNGGIIAGEDLYKSFPDICPLESTEKEILQGKKLDISIQIPKNEQNEL